MIGKSALCSKSFAHFRISRAKLGPQTSFADYRVGLSVVRADDSLTTAVCNEALSLPHCAVVIAYHPPVG